MKDKKILTIAEYELTVNLHKEDDVFIAQCSDWADCYAQGNTLEDAINEITYVASSLIELYSEEGLKIPLKLKNTTKKSTTNISLTFPLIVATS